MTNPTTPTASLAAEAAVQRLMKIADKYAGALWMSARVEGRGGSPGDHDREAELTRGKLETALRAVLARPLTLAEIAKVFVAAGIPSDDPGEHHLDIVRAIEAAHGIAPTTSKE